MRVQGEQQKHKGKEEGRWIFGVFHGEFSSGVVVERYEGETLRTPPHHQQTEKTSEHRFKVRSQVHARAPDRVKGRERQVLGQRVGQVKARRGVLQSNKLIFDELTEEVYFP